jgi:hypothetical protein
LGLMMNVLIQSVRNRFPDLQTSGDQLSDHQTCLLICLRARTQLVIFIELQGSNRIILPREQSLSKWRAA